MAVTTGGRSGRAVLALTAAAAALAGCASVTTGPGVGLLRATTPATVQAPPAEELTATAAGTDAFGLDLYHALTAQHGDQNVVLSPSGLATALAMLLPGATTTPAPRTSPSTAWTAAPPRSAR